MNSQPRKTWQRFREIPDWIDSSSKERGVAPLVVVDELEAMQGKGSQKKGLNSLSKDVKELRIQHELARKSILSQAESVSTVPCDHI